MEQCGPEMGVVAVGLQYRQKKWNGCMEDEMIKARLVAEAPYTCAKFA